jgi:autotransporter-associated beta strand protein
MRTSNQSPSVPERLTRRLRTNALKVPVTCLLLAQFALWSVGVNAADGTWILNSNGNWTGTPANWQGGIIPNGVGDVANFHQLDITGNRTVTLNAPITLGGLRINDALGGQVYTFAGSAVNTLTLNNGASNAFVSKYGSATDVWQAPMVLTSHTNYNIHTGTLDVTGASNAQVSYTGAGNTIKGGAGQLRLNIDAVSGAGYTGNFIVNFGTLAIGGANSATPTSLGNGTGGIVLNGPRSDLAILTLANNGTGNNGLITYGGNNDVVLQGASRINVDRNFHSGANSGNTIVLDNLTVNGGLLETTGANSYNLRFAGTTTLVGQTNYFAPSGATHTLELAGVITDGANSRELIKEGSGRMLISNTANTYDGVTTVKNGVLQVAAGAKLGTGAVYVNGGILTPASQTELEAAAMPGGVVLVGQLGTSRFAIPAIGNAGYTIDSSNPLNVNVPVAGMALAIDGATAVSNNINLSHIGGGSTRVWLTNAAGADRTYTGVVSAATDDVIRLAAPTNTLILSATDSLGGPGASSSLVFGYDHANPIVFTGNHIGGATGALSGTTAGNGIVSIRANNSSSLAEVTVNRGVTVNINGSITTPIGTGSVTALGGSLTTDTASSAQFGNTSFKLFAGSSLFLDNSAVTTSNTDRRLQSSTVVDLSSSTFRMMGDGTAITSAQTLAGLNYRGGSTIILETDGTTAGRLTSLTTPLSRVELGTLNVRGNGAFASTFGTGAGTQKLIISGTAPTPVNGMIGANIVLWGGANATDGSDTNFVTYDATNGLQAAAFTHTSFTGTTTASIVNLNGAAVAAGTTQSVQALRMRSTDTAHALTGGTITIGATAGAGQGAGLMFNHTSNNTVTHTSNFSFGSQEGLIYVATTGGTSGIVALSGVISGTNGVTRFGDGILSLTGTNTYTGTLTINSGETRANILATGPRTGAPSQVDLNGGSFYLASGSQRYNNNITFRDNARLGNVNVAGAMFNNLTVEARTGSNAPVVAWIQNQAGSNFTTVNGSLTLNGPAQFSVVHPLQVNGVITGTGSLDKFMNERIYFAGDSAATYAQAINVYAGHIMSLNAGSTAKPFGTGSVTIQPGGGIRVAAPANVAPGQLTVNSDHGGISGVGMTWVGNPADIPVTVNSTAPWKGYLGISAAGFDYDLDQSASGLWGGGVYLGAPLGDTGTYTGNLTPTASGQFLLGTGQGAVRIAKPLTGAGNSAVIGVSMTGGASRADQVVNNSGGAINYDVPMTYGGNTIIHSNISLRLTANNAINGTGDIILNGGILRHDTTTGQLRLIQPISVPNKIVMTGDSTIQMDDNPTDFRIGGNIELAPGSTGVVRTLVVGAGQTGGAANNAGILYLDGGVSDGLGGSGNHFIKSGIGVAMVTGSMTYTGSTMISQGFLGIDGDADLANSSQIVLAGGGLGIYERSFTTSRNMSVHGGNGYFDVAGGLTLTQAATSTIDGTSSILKRGLGTMILNGTNAQTGMIVLDGVLQINSQASLGNPNESGGTAIQLGGDQTLAGAGTATRYTGGTLRISNNMTTNRGITFNNNGNTSFGGGVDVTGNNVFTVAGVISQGSEADFAFKTGTGTLLPTGNNTWRQLVMVDGTLQFSTSTPWANSSATASSATTLELMGGTIRAVNTTANIALTNNANTTTYNYGGGGHIRMESGGGFSVEFQADNLLRANQGTLVLETGAGTTLGGAGASNAGRLIVTNAVNASLARASAMNNGIFAPHLLGADSTGAAFFLQDDATTGFKAYSGATNTSLGGSAPNAIADISAPQILTGPNSIYALRTTADIGGSGTLFITALDNLKSGGIILNGSNTISSNLVFDPASNVAPGAGTPGEALLYVKTGESAIISGNVTANALTKFGSGTLTLGGNNLITGDLSVQRGVLKLDSDSALSRLDTELNINGGASLDLNGKSVAVETLGSNNRQVATTNIGGQVTNTSATQATLAMSGPVSSSFNGTLNLDVKLVKAGTGVLTLNGYSAATPDAGNNTYTGGTEIYGYNTTGGINLNNTTFGLGGANGSAAGDVDLYGGTLGLLFNNGTTGINGTNGQQFNNMVVKFGAESGLGLTLNVRGPGLVNVNQPTPSSNTSFGQGNIMQIGTLNMTNATLSLAGGNNYRFRVAGTTNILGAQASFQTNSDGPSGVLELAGLITGSGSLNKLGDGTMRAIIITGNANDYTGGTNIIGGDVQVTATSGSALGTGAIRVFPDGTLRIAGNGSVDGSKLQVFSRVNALGAVALDNNFNPTLLTSSNFSSAYNTTLQIAQPYFNQALDLATIGDGRTFLGVGINTEGKYMAATLGAGVPDAWNPGVGVYRVVGGVNNLGFDGVDNVLTGNSFLQVGPQRNNVLGAATNTGNAVVIRNSNNYTGGTQITEGTIVVAETGGSPVGETPLGSGDIEVYGELRVQGSLGSLWRADQSAASNPIQLRPGGLIRLIDGNAAGSGGNLVAGGQGRWGDAVPLDLNGGTFRYDGAANFNSAETIGAVTVRKGGTLSVFRNSTASSAQLTVGSLAREAGGTLSITYNSGFLGTNLTTPASFERLIVSSGVTRTGTTLNGSGVVNGGIAPVWMVDATTNSYLGYDPTGAGTGFQPLISTGTPGAGEVSYNKIISGAWSAGAAVAGDVVDVTTNAKTLADNPTLYALRSNQNISPTASNTTITITSGGLLLTGGTINPTGALTAGVVSPMTLNFGAGGAGEAIIYASTGSVIQAQMVAALGLTKFGGSTLTIQSINPGIGGPVTINAGTVVARVPYSGTGSPLGAGNSVFGGQDIILNGGTLQLDPLMANAAGTATEIAFNVRAMAKLNGNITIRGDAGLNNNGQAQYVRINNLTFENGGGASAMNGNGVISLSLQSGIWVDGTTTLIPQAVVNMATNSGVMATFAGQITGNADLEKFGNGTMNLINAGNDYSGGTLIWGSTNANRVSTVASGVRGAGTPFGTGPVTVNPGGLVRISDNLNIASNAVTLKSDGVGLAGLGIAHNGVLPLITTGAAAAGQVRVESTGPFAGVLTLDYGYYSRELDMASLAGGAWWLGNSTQGEAYYFNDSLGVASNGKYLLGGGGDQSGISFGGVLVNAARTPLFENIFTGGTPNTPRLEIGALTADLAANGPSFINGNSGFQALLTRNLTLVGDTRVNTNTTLAIGNNFALGNGRLVLNGGTVRYDFGTNNYQTTNVTLDNQVLLQGDWATSSGGELVLNGNVAMHDGTAGATRIWNLTGSGQMAVGLIGGSSSNGVISGNAGSNIIKRGAQLVSFRGNNTYQGSTQIDRGEIVIVGNVLPGVSGPLGISNSPIVLGVESANNAGSLGIGGKFTVGRDILVTAAPGTGLNLIQARTNETATISGGISVASGATVTLGGLGSNNATGVGGTLVIAGPISGAGAVTFGTSSAAPNANGPVSLIHAVNGYGTSTYSGGTTFNSTRVEIGSNTYFTGPASSPTIISGPFGTGAMTWTSGETGNGASFLAVGGPRTIVNAFNATGSAADANFRFMGSEALTFTRNWDVNSEASLRNRTFQVSNPYQPVTFSGNLSNTGAQGANLLKTGSGMLILTGTNSFANLLTSNANYGTGVFIDDGILRVFSEAALGSTAALAAGGSHLAGPADIQIRGGYLSIGTGFSTDRQIALASNGNGGIDVAANETFTVTKLIRGAQALRKVGPGTLALNSNANTITTLTLGGGQQLNAGIGFYSHTGGTVSTTATSGTPFATAGIVINSGTLSLVGGASAQALSVPNLSYGAAGAIALNQGSTSSQLTVATSFARAGIFNGVNYGTLTIIPSALGNLGSTEKVLVTTGAPANTTLTGGTILTTPSVFVATGAAQDANFARYDAAAGFAQHSVTTVGTLAASAGTNVGDITSADIAGAGPIDIAALRTSANITPTDASTLIRINNGGLIFNGATAPVISADVLFGTGTGAGLKEAIVYVRGGQTGASALSGNVTALDFTKTGAGVLELAGGSNQLNTNAARLPVLSVQNGTLRFASAGAQFVNANRPAEVNDFLGSYVLNVNEAGVFDLNGIDTPVGGLVGNGTVTSGVSGNVKLVVKNGFGVDPTFSGLISNGAGTVSLTKSGNGILTMNGNGTYTGGTVIETGRVSNATGSAVGTGRVDAVTVTALGTGPISLAGGDLRFIASSLLDGTQTTNEVVDGIDGLLFGGPNGYDVTVAAVSYSNGVALPSNTTSVIRSNTQNALINSLTINAPMLTSTEGLVMVRGATTFSQDNTVLRMAGGRLFLQGQINAANKTITKTGANDVVVSHTEGGAGQNAVGLWKVYGGILNARSSEGAANPLGLNPVVELNGGNTGYGLLLNSDGDGTATAQRITTYANTTIRFGSDLPVSSNDFVASGASRLATDRILSNNDDKSITIKNIEVRGALNSAFSYFLTSNSSSIWVDGTTDFNRDWNFQADGTAITFNGAISGNGTLSRRSNGANVFFNAVNTYDGGTFFTGGGRNILGSYEGNQVTLSNTAKLGTGHVFMGPLATFQINDAGNLRAGQNIYVSSNLSWTSNFSLASDLTLEQVRLRSLGLGGIQNSASDYYLSASNPSAGVLALGTIFTQALDQRALGDGMWYLGSATNLVGANGSYDAATLAPGLGNSYRLGAGTATLFMGSNGNANVLTDVNASTPSHLIVGGPMTVQNGSGWTTGTVVLLQNQNFTGSTIVNRGSTLDFRGTLATSGIEVYGTVNAAGEGGTFIKPATGANIPVTLRPGSMIRLDNTSAGVLPASATEGRWGDTTALDMANSVLRLQGNAAVEVSETVGAITAGNGGNRIEVVRGVQGRGTELRTPSITRANNGTVQFIHNGSQLGADERVIITGTAPTVTNGMVAPWMISASDQQFVTYNADVGFTIAGFDRVQAATTGLAASVTAPNDRTQFSGNVVLNAGVDFSAYALRIDGNVTLGSAADNTAQLIIGSGGLISQSSATRTITAGIVAGSIASPSELLIYNAGTTAIGEFANANTSGQILATSITKNGAGLLQLLSNNAGFSGDIRLQQGSLELNYRNTTDVSTVDLATTVGGNGGNILIQGAGSLVNLRAGTDGTGTNFTGPTVSFNKGIVMGDYVPFATVNVDRSAGNITARTVILNGGLTFGQSNGDVGQVLRLDLRNSYNLAIHGTTLLNGRSSIAAEDSSYANTPASTVFLRGPVSGTGTLIKGPSDSKSRILELDYVNGLNDYTNGTVLQGGTLRVLARSTNVAANTATNLVAGGLGNGDITVMQGTLDLRLDGAASGAADGDIEFVRFTSGAGAGPNLFVNGSTTINADRNFYTGTYTRAGGVVTATLPGGHGFTVGQSINISTGANTGSFTITGVTGNTITYADATGTATGGSFVANNNSGSSKYVTFNNMTIGSQILTLTSGNSYGFAVGGTTTLLGNAFINTGVNLVLGGAAGASGTANSIVTDGGGVIINKVGTGTLWVHSANTSLAANVYINAGLLAFGNASVGNTTASLGMGDIFVNPGAQIQVRGTGNINTGLGQQVVLTGTPYAPAVFRSTFAATQANLQSLIQARTTTSNEVSYLSWEAAPAAANYDQSLIGDGRIFFGAIAADRTYSGAATGSALTPGLANLPNSVIGGTSSNRVYRLGGGDTTARTLVINLTAAGAGLGDVGGATDVQIGSQAILGPTGNFNTGFVYFQDQNTYTGQTVVARGMTLRFNTTVNAGETAGPLGANADAPIHVYGGLRTETNSSVRNSAGTANFYNNIILHPTSTLTFQDMAVGGNRWDDNTAINLDGSALVGEAVNNVDNGSETVGAITFDRGSRIILTSEGTGDAFVTAASVTRAAAGPGAGTGRGTLVVAPSNTAQLGVAAAAGSAQQQLKFTSAPTPSATSAVSGMLPGYYIDGNGHRFVTHGANGITPVADGSMVAFSAGMTAGTAVVNVTSTSSLPDFNPVIFGLRGGNVTLSSPTGANNDATITLAGSGSDVGAVISSASTFTIHPNLKFGTDGTNEALFYAGGNITMNGNITAGSITKFGTGTLTVANDQSDAARGTGKGFQGGWVINEGAVTINQFGGLGNATAGNTVVLNGSQASSAVLNLRAQPGDTLLNYTYTSGKIYAVDFATLDWDPGAADRVHRISDLEIQQSGGIGNAATNGSLDAYFRVAIGNSRTVLSAGTLTVASNAILNVDTTAGMATFAAASTNAAYLTNSISSGLSIASLIGANRFTKWGDGTLYVRGDSSATFSGDVVIDQGAVFVTHNGSLGTGPLVVNRYGTLEIGVANFAPTNSSVTYNEGSIERWSVNSARSGAIDLGKATLQVAANQPTTSATVTLNGGGIQAYVNADGHSNAQASGGVLRILNPNVNFVLAGDSFIGDRYYEGANGLDSGKQAHDNRAMEETLASGAILEVQGVISGPGGLTKAGYDTVILSGQNTYQGSTVLTGGKVMVGTDNALPTGTSLVMTSNAVLDLNGQNQTVGSVSNVVATTNVNSTSGFITNGATSVNTLTVGNGVSSNFSFGGVIQHNVALTKTGSAAFTLTNANTYLGATTISQGTLTLGVNGSINDSPWINVGAGATLNVTAKVGGYQFDGTVSGGGTDAAGTTFATVTNAARIAGNLVVTDNVGSVSRIGSLAPGASSGGIATAGDQIGHLYVDGDLALSGQLAGTVDTAIDRLILQLSGSTFNLGTLGYDYSTSFESFIDSLAPTTPELNGAAGNLGNHDYINVAGQLSLNRYGTIRVETLGSYSPAAGDAFNIMDWNSVNTGSFNAGSRYQTGLETTFDLNLPALSGGLFWDTSKFLSSGTVFVVPEPSRMLLLFLGLFGLLFRRRR